MRSMTGYGTAEGKVGKGRLFVEVKSVNHRFSEFNIKIPPRMGALDSRIRKCLQKFFERGKVDVFFKEKVALFGGVSISIDRELAHKYHRIVEKLQKELGIRGGSSNFLELVGLDKIIHIDEREGNYEKLWGQITRLLDRASTHVLRMKEREGDHIRRDQELRLTKIFNNLRHIKGGSARALKQHYDRVRRKVSGRQGPTQLDEQRVQQEVAILGGRQDIAEEITRLESHLKQYLGLLRRPEPVGRKLDFLLQEMNREINTIGAKAADAHISGLVVDCKAELERLREQVQNIE